MAGSVRVRQSQGENVSLDQVKEWRVRLRSAKPVDATWWTATDSDSIRSLFEKVLPSQIVSADLRVATVWPSTDEGARLARASALTTWLQGTRTPDLRQTARFAGNDPWLWSIVWLVWPGPDGADELPPWPAVLDLEISGWLCAKIEGAGFTDRVEARWADAERFSCVLRWGSLSQFTEDSKTCFETAERILTAWRLERGWFAPHWVYTPVDAWAAGDHELYEGAVDVLGRAGVKVGDVLLPVAKDGHIAFRSTRVGQERVYNSVLDPAVPLPGAAPAKGYVERAPESVVHALRETRSPLGEPLCSELVKAPAPPLRPTNRILYGPPGTGKTWSTTKQGLELCGVDLKRIKCPDVRRIWFEHLKQVGRIDVVTFHPAYEYEDFIIGLRPSSGGADGDMGSTHFEWQAGAFKRLSDEARRALDAAANGGERGQDSGAPGPGDSSAEASAASDLSPAGSAPELQYVLVIDEINRGNIARIFGELLTLVEPSKRYGMPEAASVRIPGSSAEAERGANLFSVPRNLHLLGTMNTADRSIALMDVALRRRFKFKELMPDGKVLSEHLKRKNVDPELARMAHSVLVALNERIVFLYDREHQIGHSFFMGVRSWRDLRAVMLDEVLPLLQEYFYGAWDRVCLVLGCPYKFVRNGDPKAARKASSHAVKAGEIYVAPIIGARVLNEERLLGFDHDDFENKLDYFVDPDFKIAAGREALKVYFEGILTEPFERQTSTTQGGTESGQPVSAKPTNEA